MRLWLGLVLVAIVAGMAYVRLAPSDPARWHAMPESLAPGDLAGGAVRVVPGDLAALDAIIRATPRTQILAGDVAQGMITYVTRSRVFGFPDYTTVRQTGERLEIYGRLRFGKSDLGVNAARIDGWLQRLGQAGG
ncbi:MAG: DUF1499 domain-containing protein [Roseovarius sp.]|uniref:DUF1499 domain-containing protein n=1 Tax=Roseovarius sp. TaxID=1486281 RepID=UPI001B47B5D7|nr:DUF1499 domain-containing protein [Roseovarius sp.]MBQ0749371.1 DUF1499 domain-containing protein [Roseovarius sp.]MBQ0810057.1 DUF1499 domain-containing protein [Roseovarius sp.]